MTAAVTASDLTKLAGEVAQEVNAIKVTQAGAQTDGDDYDGWKSTDYAAKLLLPTLSVPPTPTQVDGLALIFTNAAAHRKNTRDKRNANGCIA